MMRRRLVLVVTLILVATAACGSPQDDTGSEGSGDINIAFIGDLTGPVAPYSSASLEAVRIAFNAANEAGGIDGRKLKLDVYDDKNDPVQTVNIVKRVTPSATAVMIASGSANVLSAGPFLERAGKPFIVTVSSNPGVTSSGWEWVNRVHLSDADQVERVLTYAVDDQGLDRVGVIHDTSDLGQGGAELVEAGLEERGLQVAADEAYNPESNDFSNQITALRGVDLDALIFWGVLDAGARVADQMAALNMTDVQLLGGGGLVSDEFIELAGDAAEGTIASWAYVDPDNPALKAMTSAYEEKTGRAPDVFAAQSYDGANILIEALNDAGTEPAELQDAIRSSVHEGAVGTIEFDDTGQNIREIHLGVVKDGRWALLE